jgi:hypothetical protein
LACDGIVIANKGMAGMSVRYYMMLKLSLDKDVHFYARICGINSKRKEEMGTEWEPSSQEFLAVTVLTVMPKHTTTATVRAKQKYPEPSLCIHEEDWHR